MEMAETVEAKMPLFRFINELIVLLLRCFLNFALVYGEHPNKNK
jgi:hypothetical protein